MEAAVVGEPGQRVGAGEAAQAGVLALDDQQQDGRGEHSGAAEQDRACPWMPRPATSTAPTQSNPHVAAAGTSRRRAHGDRLARGQGRARSYRWHRVYLRLSSSATRTALERWPSSSTVAGAKVRATGGGESTRPVAASQADHASSERRSKSSRRAERVGVGQRSELGALLGRDRGRARRRAGSSSPACGSAPTSS